MAPAAEEGCRAATEADLPRLGELAAATVLVAVLIALTLNSGSRRRTLVVGVTFSTDPTNREAVRRWAANRRITDRHH